jgi:hypothetical protein
MTIGKMIVYKKALTLDKLSKDEMNVNKMSVG